MAVSLEPPRARRQFASPFAYPLARNGTEWYKGPHADTHSVLGPRSSASTPRAHGPSGASGGRSARDGAVKIARLRDLASEVSALPPFASGSLERWTEVEGATGAVLDALPALSHQKGGPDALFDFGDALLTGGDECGAEEVWEALVQACPPDRPDLSAYCAARLSHCALGQREVRTALDWCRRGRRWSREVPANHPVHLALLRQRGLISYQHLDGPTARRALVAATLLDPSPDLALRWERRTPADLRGALHNDLARLALDRTGEGKGQRAALLVDEARGWIAENMTSAGSATVSTQAIALAAEASLCEGDLREARRRIADWRSATPLPGGSKMRFEGVFLHLGALAALAEHDLGEARKLAGQAFRAVPAAGDPDLERRIVRDLVRVFIRDHEERYSGRRESTVLRTLDAGGSWILELVAFAESRDRYLAGHHGRLVRAACMGLLPPAEERGRAGSSEDLGADYLLGAASLHDIGKLELAWPLLNRVRPMGPKQRERLRSHAPNGARLLESLGFPMAARIVEEHHERADGKGYPLGTKILTPAGGLLALAEVLVTRAQRSEFATHSETLARSARWCLNQGRHRFRPEALLALRYAMESGNMDPLASALH